MRYTFGNTDTAASRLETIARFFNPLAAQFIQPYIKNPVAVAIDLGCGPGFTTDMLSIASKASKIVGFDNSDHFIKMARNQFPKYNFILHDITKFPFPLKADVMYCRFLLSHLNDVIGLINNWISELNPGGMLFIDELEDIFTDNDIFKKYLNIAEGLVASQNASLFVGKILATGKYKGTVLSNDSYLIPVQNALAATWFFPNTVSVWEKESFVLKNTTSAERQFISSTIHKIRESGDLNTDITWKMRSLVIRK